MDIFLHLMKDRKQKKHQNPQNNEKIFENSFTVARYIQTLFTKCFLHVCTLDQS